MDKAISLAEEKDPEIEDPSKINLVEEVSIKVNTFIHGWNGQ